MHLHFIGQAFSPEVVQIKYFWVSTSCPCKTERTPRLRCFVSHPEAASNGYYESRLLYCELDRDRYERQR